MSTKYTLKVRVYLILATAYSALIVMLSLVNLGKVEIIKLEASDKIYHAVCYAGMIFLWSLCVKSRLNAFKIRTIFVLILVISIFGIIIEYLQLVLTNYRTFDWWDVLANFTGVILGMLIFISLQKLFKL